MLRNKWKYLQSQPRKGVFLRTYQDIMPPQLPEDSDVVFETVTKTIYKQLKGYLFVADFPISRDDKLFDTLGVDPNEVDEIIQAALESYYGGKVRFQGNRNDLPQIDTIGGLVLFIVDSVRSGVFSLAG